MTVVLVGLLSACEVRPERGAAPVVPPAQTFVDAADQTISSGVVGEPYTGAVTASGGVAPYRWLAVEPLPTGLTLAPDGSIGGVPVEAGTFTTRLVVTDAEGRSKPMFATFTAVLIPRLVRCGGHLEGHFRDSAFDEEGVDLSRLRDLAWLAVELPDDATTRVELVLSATVDATAWVQRVNGLLGSWDLTGYAARGVKVADGPRSVPIDAGTDPSLTEFSQQTLLPVLFAGKDEGDWALDVVCTDGPVFESTTKYPKAVGDTFTIDYEVFGDNAGVRIWTDDPLPPWITWDDTTGTLTGTAEEVGTWEFTLHARDAAGHERTEIGVFGVYTWDDVACGQVAPVHVTEAWKQGEHTKRYDPRGFSTFRVPLDDGPEVSTVELRVRGSTGHYLGLARPDPGWQRYFGQAEEREVEGNAKIRVESTSYPSTRHFRDAGELWFTAGSTDELDLEGLEVEVVCDTSPKPDILGLPVLDVLEAVDLRIDGIGGVPPYRWAAEGLPSGLRIDAEGRVTGASGEVGTHRVDFTLTDALGAEGTARLEWPIGTEAACLGLRELGCGDAVDGSLTGDEGSDTRDSFCVKDTSVNLGFAVYADHADLGVTLGDPGLTRRDQLTDPGRGTWVADVSQGAVLGVPFDEFSFPWRPDYDRRPLFVTLWAEEATTYTLELDCPVVPTKP